MKKSRQNEISLQFHQFFFQIKVEHYLLLAPKFKISYPPDLVQNERGREKERVFSSRLG